MISRGLAIAGTLLLLSAAVASSWWAWSIVHHHPPISIFSPNEAAWSATSQPRQGARPPKPEEFFEEITERPLFSPERRPVSSEDAPLTTMVPPVAVSVATATPPPGPVPHPQLRLMGVMGTNEIFRALVLTGEGETAWLTEGTLLAGWKIAEIGATWLDIRHETQTIRIEMYQR